MLIYDEQGKAMLTTRDGEGKPVMQEIASIKRDIHRVFYGTVLRNEDDTLLTRGAGKGLRIYDELKRDAHAGAVLDKRKLAVTMRPWEVQPASEAAADVAAAELVTKALEHLRFNNLRKRLLEATLKGYAVAEVLWEIRDGAVLPHQVVARDARRFVFDFDGRLRLRTQARPTDGEELPSRKFVVHRRGADDDSPYGHGIGGSLFWPVFFKRNGITFWLTFADKFGNPTPVGKYPTGSDKTEQDKLLAALAALAQDTGVIVPEGMVIELLEAQRSGTVDTYEKLVRYMDEQISKRVLGETMSTTASSAGLGSSQADVQNEVRLEVAQDDAAELDETLNDSLVRWIVEFNMPGAGLPRLKTLFEEPEDLEARARRDKTLHDMGWEPSDDYMLETYGEGWTKRPPAPPPLGFGAAFGAGGDEPGAVPGGTAQEPEDDDDAAFAEAGRPMQQARGLNRLRQAELVAAAQALASEYEAIVGPRVQALRAMLDETGDLASFREQLGKLVLQAPTPQAVERLARATFAAGVVARGKAPKPQGLLGRLKAAVRRGR